MKPTLLIISLLLTEIGFAQSLGVDSVYNFSPHILSKAAQGKIMVPLDEFWSKVNADTAKNLPLLRNELNANHHRPFFYYDGAMLLLSVSSKYSDKAIAANALLKCDLLDIDRQQYVKTLNKFARDGFNITSAAVKILNDTSYSFFLEQHVMSFKQGECLTYMLLPQPPAFYIDTLTTLFKTVNANAQTAILYCLWFAYTCKGDLLINAAAHDKTLRKSVADYARDLMKPADRDKEIKKEIDAIDTNHANELIKSSLRRFSDEALSELMMGTLALRKNVGCR